MSTQELKRDDVVRLYRFVVKRLKSDELVYVNIKDQVIGKNKSAIIDSIMSIVNACEKKETEVK